MRPAFCVSSEQARNFLQEQLQRWPLARKNFDALNRVETKAFDLDGITILAQFNPARITSSGAKTDAKTISERKCFLCPSNLPPEQMKLSFGEDYLILCNPYPIFPEHFTVPSIEHTDQLILPRFYEFLELASCLEEFTVFYNGPRSGASAPDHAHFQVVTKGMMPIDNELDKHIKRCGQLLVEKSDSQLFVLRNYIRNGFVIRSNEASQAFELFKKVYHSLPVNPGDPEPSMNIFGYYKDGRWTVAVIPRRQHRPWQYSAEGEDRMLLSPGAADIGGLFIIPLEKDFKRISPELLRDVYQQVCFNDTEIEKMASHIVEG